MYDLLKYLPNYYRKSLVIAAILTSMESELIRLNDGVGNTQKQFFIAEADSALSYYEKDIGIVINENDSYEVRRSRIISRLRGTGTVTKTMLQNVVSSFINGTIEINEVPSENKFTIRFVSTLGIPEDIAFIQKSVEDIKPAHLAVEYLYTYRTWADMKSTFTSWDDLKSYTWANLMTLEIVKNLYIDVDGRVYYRPDGDGNAIIIYIEGKPYARLYEGG